MSEMTNDTNFNFHHNDYFPMDYRTNYERQNNKASEV